MGMGIGTRREEKDLFVLPVPPAPGLFRNLSSKSRRTDKVGFGWIEGVCEISAASQGALWETRDFLLTSTVYTLSTFWSPRQACLTLS